MIPKIIHYCWFGKNEKNLLIQDCIKSWKINLPDWEFIEWNEDNFDINKNQFVKENYKRKKWAFVSDYVRLEALYRMGGVYLDTDVKVFKNFEPFLNHNLFLGFMFDCNLGTAVIGSEKNNKTIQKILNLYENLPVGNSPNNDLFTNFFLNNYPEFSLDGSYQRLSDGTTIYPKEFFERPTYSSNMGYSMHNFQGSWYNKKEKVHKKIIKFFLGKVLYYKLSHFQAIKTSPFKEIYYEHKSRNANN
jgi:mannosyltransferase OCH1-like enzyme